LRAAVLPASGAAVISDRAMTSGRRAAPIVQSTLPEAGRDRGLAQIGRGTMGGGTFTIRREGAFWVIRAGDVVVHHARSKPDAVTWATRRSTSVYVQNFAGRLARYVPGAVDEQPSA
jgi:hypothetical protein